LNGVQYALMFVCEVDMVNVAVNLVINCCVFSCPFCSSGSSLVIDQEMGVSHMLRCHGQHSLGRGLDVVLTSYLMCSLCGDEFVLHDAQHLQGHFAERHGGVDCRGLTPAQFMVAQVGGGLVEGIGWEGLGREGLGKGAVLDAHPTASPSTSLSTSPFTSPFMSLSPQFVETILNAGGNTLAQGLTTR